MDKYIGKRLEGRYDILELIGRGGMANVYRAHDSIDNKTVAVKVLRDEYSSNEEFLRRFKNESKAIALLNHPNIVKVHDVSFSDIHYIVMEYIDGVTLKNYIEHKGAIPYRDAVHFTIQILHALQHAHDKGIVHRDIKPQNIMLLRDGKIKVTDFGIARFARSDSRTITNRAIGSVHYISPEQAMGEYTDEKSDIYSTGIMLYEMLTGTLPFEADTAVSVAIKQIQMPIKRPTIVNPSIPLGLEEITLRSVQKSSKLRFQSAAEMISDLEVFKANPSVIFGYNTAISATNQTQQPQQSQPRKPNGGQPPQKGATPNALQRRDAAGQPPKNKGEKDKKGKKPKKVKKHNQYLRMMFVATLIVVIGTVAFAGIMIYMNNPFVEVGEIVLPNIVGQDYEAAAQLYNEFEIIVVGRENRDDFTAGKIYEQSPKNGSTIKIGGKVNVYVSDGSKEIPIEDYAERPAARVNSELRTLGLTVLEERVNDDELPVGRVIETDPPAGSIVTGSDTIVLYVSIGPEDKLLSMPDVTSMPIDDAVEFLEEQKFEVGEIITKPDDMPEGTVIAQDPSPGTMHYTKVPVTLTVSAGGLERLMLSVPLPTGIDREVPVRARVGEGDNPELVAEETLVPADSTTGYWVQGYTALPGETIRVRIYIDGMLYQDYDLDFETGEHKLTKDNSRASVFQH